MSETVSWDFSRSKRGSRVILQHNWFDYGRQYYVRVTGHHSLGMGAHSEVRTVKPYGSTAPLDVKLSRVVVSPSSIWNGLRVTLAHQQGWRDPITKYRVEYSTDDFSTYTREIQHLRVLAQGGYYRLTYDTSMCPTCMVKPHTRRGRYHGLHPQTPENSVEEFAKYWRH